MLNPEILNLLTTYNHNFSEFNNLKQFNLPSNLRLFNIRFNLAIDLRIDFYREITLTQTPRIRELYSLIMKLMEIWNSYEVLIHYSKDLELTASNESIYKIYTQRYLQDVGSLAILERTLNSFKDRYNSNKRFRSCFNNYIQMINSETRLRENLRSSCTKILEYFKGEKDISGIEIIALVYAERNMYYHNGETANMGMNPGNRVNFLTELIDCFIIHILKIINNVLEREIDEAQN